MKQLDLQQKETITRTYYKRATVPAAPIARPLEGSYLYIGAHFQYVTNLLKGFDSSFYFENTAAAGKVLKSKEGIKTTPEFILLDGELPITAIQQLIADLKTVKNLAHTPVLAEIQYCTPAQVNKLKVVKGIDDLIVLTQSAAVIRSKVKFIHKFKASQSDANLDERIENGSKESFSLNAFFKRTFDLLVSTVLILLLSPVFLLIALCIRLESNGPIFYASKRAGRGYKVFKFYKFRTMVVGADSKVADLLHLNQYGANAGSPVFFKISNDPRITRLGAFLRNSSLDELPQLFNVFLGDMSLVGNRPLPLYEAASLTSDSYAARFMAPAGITGLWQIKKRGCGNMSVEERIDLDIDYAEKHSFLYDLWIIANTPSALLQKENV